MIRVEQLRKSYGTLVAVDGITFEVNRGETFGLLGPNGAGKTTTIHMMIGALRPDGGTIEYDGRHDPTRPAVRRQVGLVPQSLAVYPELTAEENLTFFGRMYGLEGKNLRDRVDWALDFAGLQERRGDLVKKYSGGMHRRLNLACSLVHEPSILLLDEPTVGVDPQSRNRIFENIETLKQKGLTVLYTTHYMDEAQRLCDRVAIMDNGQILDVGTVDELVDRHGGPSTVEVELETVPEDRTALPVEPDGDMLRIETDQPVATVSTLVGSDLSIRSLNIRRPGLESVFLQITGRELRDE